MDNLPVIKKDCYNFALLLILYVMNYELKENSQPTDFNSTDLKWKYYVSKLR